MNLNFYETQMLGPYVGRKYRDLGASYVDDCVFYSTDSCPKKCIEKICAISSVVFDVFSSFGLQLRVYAFQIRSATGWQGLESENVVPT